MRLFIEGKEVDLSGGDKVVITKAVNSLSDLDSRQGDYSNTFKLPKSTRNREILEDLHQIHSATKKPYRKLPSLLLAGGVEFYGFSEIRSCKDDYEVLFTSGNADFFGALEGLTLRDLDFAEYNHRWRLSDAVASQGRTDGYVYAVADYHKDSPNAYINTTDAKVDLRTIKPVLFLHNIVEKIFQKVGFFKDAARFEQLNPEYKSIGMPLTLQGEQPLAFATNRQIIRGTKYPEINQTWISNKGVDDGEYVRIPFAEKIHDPFDFFQNTTEKGTSPQKPSKQDYLRQSVKPYGYSFSGTLTAEFFYKKGHFHYASIQLWEDNGPGSTAKLIEEKTLSDVLIPFEGIGRVTFQHTIDFTEGVSINRFYFVLRNQANLLSVTYNSYGKTVRVNGTLKIEEVSRDVRYGHPIEFNQLLPAMPLKDVIKTVFLMYNIIPITTGRTVKWLWFKEIIWNKNIAYDWSNLIDESELPAINFHSEFGQINLMKWAETDQSKDENSTLLIDDETLERQKEIVKMPFAVYPETLRCSGIRMAKIEEREEGAAKGKIKDFLVRLRKIDIAFNFFDNIGGWDFTAPWIADSNGLKWADLKNRSYLELENILNNYKEIELPLRLGRADVQQFDFSRPVFLLNSYWYCAEIIQHELTSNDSTLVKLIKI
jgi:hypothetical protein